MEIKYNATKTKTKHILRIEKRQEIQHFTTQRDAWKKFSHLPVCRCLLLFNACNVWDGPPKGPGGLHCAEPVLNAVYRARESKCKQVVSVSRQT